METREKVSFQFSSFLPLFEMRNEKTFIQFVFMLVEALNHEFNFSLSFIFGLDGFKKKIEALRGGNFL
jgi:hypothetical protein